MKTSNFANNARYALRGISISRYPDKRSGFSGPEFPPLFPSEDLLKLYKLNAINWADYEVRYRLQLATLNPMAAWNHLEYLAGCQGTQEPILLCYESAKTLDSNPCHRRIVAAWFFEELGFPVPEWSKDG